MKPKLLLNLVLLVVLATLAGVAFFEPGKEEAKAFHLTELDVDAINRFELTNPETLVFEKHDAHWWLASPIQAPANDIRIQQLLNIAKAESQAHYPVKPEDLTKYGLDKPQAVLKLGQLTLLFGGLEPIDMLRYVQIGQTLHLVSDDFSHHLLAKSTDYVDKKLLPEDSKIKELLMPGLTAKLGDKGQWSLEPPGNAAAMSELANTWQSARAIEVKRHEGQPQGDSIHIVLTDGKSVDFVIIQREPDILLARPDWKLQYMVSAESGKRLLSLQNPTAEADEGQEEEDSESTPAAANDADKPKGKAKDKDSGEDVDTDSD